MGAEGKSKGNEMSHHFRRNFNVFFYVLCQSIAKINQFSLFFLYKCDEKMKNSRVNTVHVFPYSLKTILNHYAYFVLRYIHPPCQIDHGRIIRTKKIFLDPFSHT